MKKMVLFLSCVFSNAILCMEEAIKFEFWNKFDSPVYVTYQDQDKIRTIENGFVRVDPQDRITSTSNISQIGYTFENPDNITFADQVVFYLVNPQKTAFVRLRKHRIGLQQEEFKFSEQSGLLLGLIGKTQSGLSLENNVKMSDGDIVRVSYPYLPYNTNNQNNALFNAIRSSNGKLNPVIRILKNAKYLVSAPIEFNWTPLHEAQLWKFKEINSYLKKIGANPWAQTVQGFTAKDIKNKIINWRITFEKPHLIPVGLLESLGLCPLFPNLAEDLLIRKQEKENLAPEYYTKTAPCIVKYDKNDTINREIIQLNSVNQLDKRIGGERCPTLSLRSALIMNEWYKTKNNTVLKKLYTIKDALSFIQAIACPATLEIENLHEVTQNDIDQYGPIDWSSISLVSGPLVFDRTYLDILGDLAEFVVHNYRNREKFELDEYRNTFENWLNQKKFFHTFIIGTNDETSFYGGKGGRQHWYNLSVIKDGNTIQYVIIDTNPEAHLVEGSYELKRLKYFIDLFERGETDISLNPAN